MNIKVTTTVTSVLDTDTLQSEHFTDIRCNVEGVPSDVIFAGSIAGLKATMLSLAAEQPHLMAMMLEEEK